MIGEERDKKLVFLHGLMGAGNNWRRIAPHFQGEFQILLFDQRGHGRSFQPENGYAPEDYAQDLLNILDELGWQKIHVLGHSMGGRNALQFAADHPGRVEKLVIEDIGPSIQKKNAGNIQRLLSIVPTPFASKKRAREFFMGEFEAKIPENPQRKVLSQFFYTNIEEKSDGTASWRFSKSGVLESVRQGHLGDRWAQVKSLKVPTLVIRGERSDDLTREDFDKMLQENVNIKGVEIKDSGHWVHFDQPKALICAVQSFFDPSFKPTSI